MINVTRWRPDTCDCVIEYSWDSESNEDERVHTYHDSHTTCDDHRTHHKKAKHFEVVQEENQRKNKAHGEWKKLHPEVNDDDFKFSFDGQRKLHVSYKGLTAKTKKDLEAKLALLGDISI